ncbi:MAG: homoserine dehydrogenase [Lewinellaceae bacterium]|nr:homoserine dehydrogenase [Lewinellaceae bacterium]
MKKKPLTIGLFGLGVVGSGLLEVLKDSGYPDAVIRKICVKTPGKTRAVPQELLTFNPSDILDDPSIDTVVETINGSDDAFDIVSRAMRQGKNVVTANKKMLAGNFELLLNLQEATGVSLLYESAACGSIPIVRTLEQHFGTEPLEQLSGIFNGTSNYILSRMFDGNLDFDTALRQAQQAGFAEEDPASDIDGLDAKYKLILLTAHSHGMILSPDQVPHFGIRHLRPEDIRFARDRGLRIKLLPVCRRTGPGRLAVYVIPGLVGDADELFRVDDEFNGVLLQSDYSGAQFLRGRGAGGRPTGSALLSDLLSLQQGYRYAYQKHRMNGSTVLDDQYKLRIYARAPSEIPLQALPFPSPENITRDGNTYVIESEVTLSHLGRQARWLQENEVFVMRML